MSSTPAAALPGRAAHEGIETRAEPTDLARWRRPQAIHARALPRRRPERQELAGNVQRQPQPIAGALRGRGTSFCKRCERVATASIVEVRALRASAAIVLRQHADSHLAGASADGRRRALHFRLDDFVVDPRKDDQRRHQALMAGGRTRRVSTSTRNDLRRSMRAAADPLR